MKIKKLKRLLKCIQAISKRKIEEVHLANSGMINGLTGQPIFVLPSRGKHVLPETLEIIKIMKSIEPVDFLKEAKKINAAARMHVISAYQNEKNPYFISAAVHAVYGIIPFNIIINHEEPKVTLEMVEDGKTTEVAVNSKTLPEAEIM